jgi:hypothetical protein
VPHPATPFVRDAVRTLNAALSAGDAHHASRINLAFPTESLRFALRLLTEAQDDLTAGASAHMSTVVQAMARIREASNAIESTRGFVRWMPAEVVDARADALQLLDQVTRRW